MDFVDKVARRSADWPPTVLADWPSAVLADWPSAVLADWPPTLLQGIGPRSRR